MNLGLLLPRSQAYPGIGLEFMAGLKSFLAKQGLTNSVKFFTENIGFGGLEKEAYEKAEKLLLVDEVDVLVAYVDLKVTAILEPLLYSSGKFLIVVNPGANYPSNWIAQPNIVYLTLQHAFLCWLTGSLARERAIMASTFYDCGYLHMSAMAKGFVKQGGSVVFNYINNQPYDQFEIKQLTDFLSSDKETKNLLCVFDSYPASLFSKLLNEFTGAKNLHVFASPMMLEQKALEAQTAPFKFQTEGYIPWSLNLENETNQNFMQTYRQREKKEPTLFSLLGWEIGMVIQQLIQLANGAYEDGAALTEQLKKIALDGPRGTLRLDSYSNYFTAPVYKCLVNPETLQVEINNDGSEEKWKSFTEERVEGLSSGWTNTYLCY